MARQRRQPHTNLVKACLELLHLHGLDAWKNATGAVKVGNRLIRYGELGSPDILGQTCAGIICGVECKIGSDPVHEGQALFLRRMHSHKGHALVVGQVEQLHEWLNMCSERGWVHHLCCVLTAERYDTSAGYVDLRKWKEGNNVE